MRITFIRLATTAVVATYAVFATLSGLDRLAGEDGGYPAVVDWAYARNARYQAANAAAMAKQWDLAKSLMQRALVTDPVNERMIGNLGLIRLSARDAAGADAAFRVSAQRGWRDPVTHAYWMNQSLAAGDFANAAIQADALLHGQLSAAQSGPIVDALMEYDEGRTALASRLRGNPPWAKAFAWDFGGQSAPSLAARADVIGRTGVGVWACHDTASLINQVIAAGFLTEARAAHDTSCAQSAGTSGNLVNDARFVRYRAESGASQFDWSAPDSTDVTIAAAQQGNPATGVEVTATRGVTMQVLAQQIVAGPGTYRLTWRMPGTDAQSAHALAAGLGCQPDLAKTAPGAAIAGSADTYAAMIGFSGECAAPILSFWLRPTQTAVTLDDVTLKRVEN